jgi:hypothetical protein
MNILFITYEFIEGIFSGNGVYARGQVRALEAAGNDVLVLAARPQKSQILLEKSEAKIFWVWKLLDCPSDRSTHRSCI